MPLFVIAKLALAAFIVLVMATFHSLRSIVGALAAGAEAAGADTAGDAWATALAWAGEDTAALANAATRSLSSRQRP